MIKKIIKRIKYFGFKHKCPVCNSSHSGYLKAGLYVKRFAAKCPLCGSLERHRQLWLIVEKYNISEKSRLLHFAPEKCLSERFDKLGAFRYETSEYDINLISNYHFDITDINLNDNIYNFIICSHVLEHVENDISAMSEMYRILQVNGVLFLQVPVHQDLSKKTFEDNTVKTEKDRILYFGQFDHVRIYGLDIQERLKSVGFKVERVDLIEELDKKTINFFGLNNHSGVKDFTFICTKAKA